MSKLVRSQGRESGADGVASVGLRARNDDAMSAVCGVLGLGMHRVSNCKCKSLFLHENFCKS